MKTIEDVITFNASGCIGDNYPNEQFRIMGPKLETMDDYLKIFQGPFSFIGTSPLVEAENFIQEIQNLKQRISSKPGIANILKGPHFPVLVPRFGIKNIGEIAKNLLEILERKYSIHSRKFYNRCGQDLDAMDIFRESRHELIINKIKSKNTALIYFPNALSGISLKESRKVINLLPEGFVLSGIEVIVASIIYEELLNGRNLPSLVLEGICSKTDYHHTFFIQPSKSSIDFYKEVHLGHYNIPSENYSFGISYLHMDNELPDFSDFFELEEEEED
jgi:hypothetical protein